MKKYEAMVIIKPELSEEERKILFTQISDLIVKNSGNVSAASVWAEKKKMYFSIKKHHEGTYYLVNFTAATEAIAKLRHALNLNENVLRVLFTKIA